jgi:DNA-directed RNA polymerase subunit RPC12/RpoP
MKKIEVTCWEAQADCEDGNVQKIWYTIPDFGDAKRLYTCVHCGALLAVDPDEEFYTKRQFMDEKNALSCPECKRSLADALPYPEYFRCAKSGKVERFVLPTKEIPHDYDSLVKEFWNPLE